MIDTRIISLPRMAPGNIFINPDTTPEESLILEKDKAGTHLIKGQVLAVGPDITTEFGKFIQCPVIVGDIVVFLTYESSIDIFKINGKKYHFVQFKDIRAIL